MVPSYQEGGTQFYEEQVVYRYTFKTTINLSYVLFYEKRGGEGRASFDPAKTGEGVGLTLFLGIDKIG